MNIFILHLVASICAKYHCDRHVVKLILESAQMLCTAHRFLDDIDEIDGVPLYKQAHLNHPCTKWTRETSENYKWHYNLFIALCDEYTYRYEKIHKTDSKLRQVLANLPKNIPIGEITPFALAMPDEYKVEGDAVESYRRYYNRDKRHLFNWTKRNVPSWVELDDSDNE